ncbi:LacI family transcriptional regulator [Labedella gwakjiensis]|uniref:LacI family transcriptional regulator n=1 Tax=Labedella gwakjiensis TaxID=390269 RepID=A0A2P8GU57_9MICO|nr:LacI family DNA-binding transcriptional regulator [Labedella gwakjiensis]PSL37507.1 LacI family transcriptional regulator [Labedella gwakjiensis]RUQ84810.1 LacI family transcriptional regulator [Labedella gwakjiensis]
MSRITLKDVGEHVGVSAKTVSNVVNDTGWVTEELKARVRSAIKELGYRPNAAARQLRSGRSGMIAVALPDLAQPYFAELASALVRAAEARSITVLVNQTNGQAEAERRISNGVGIPVMDGLILSALALTAEDLSDRLDTTPIVLLGEHIGVSPFPHVAVDSIAAAQAATAHLIASGRRRIAAIGAQTGQATETADLRLEGYKAALDAAGIPLDESLVCTVDQFVRADGAAAASSLLDAGAEFDAVFAFNDLLALGAMHEFTERGLRIPDDVAVMGFDDIEEARFSSPALSTVSPDTDAIARCALDLLLNEASDAENRDIEMTIPFEIVKRAST